ncbi:MAG: ATP-binding protein [Acidimicrobiia bacterium]
MTNAEFRKASGQPFVGRSAELDVLLDAFLAAVDGRGSAVFVAGEPGIGKTRLVDEFTARVRRGGAFVSWATCREDGGGPSFWPWVQVIRSCIEAGCNNELDPALLPRVADAERLVGAEAPQDEPGGDQARFRLFDSITALLTHSCTATPMVVVVEDLHWADVPSIEFLRFFVPELRGARLLLVGTYRDADVDVASDVGQLLWAAIRASPSLRMAGLARNEVRELLASTAGETASEELLDAVFTRSSGNPLFVGEFGRLLRTHTAIAPAELSVPEGIRAVMHHRLRRLTPSCRDVLAMAAVVGERFSTETLARSLGCDEQDVLDVLDETTRARVTVADGSPRAEFRFTHALMRDALYEDLPSSRRVALHARAADALEALGATDDERIAELATHAVRSGSVDRAVWSCERAGQWALAQLAYERSADYFRTALQLLPSGADPAQRTTLLLALGDALMGANDVVAARSALSEAAGLARARREPDDLARAALGFAAGLGGFEVRMFDAAQITLLEEALSGMPDGDSAVRALLLARLSVAVSFVQSEEQRRDLSSAAVAVARGANDKQALAHALAAHCDAIAGPERLEERVAAASEAVRLALHARDAPQELLARRLLLVALMEVGDLPGAWREADAFARAAERVRQPVYSLYVPIWRCARALVEGRLDETLAYADEAEAIGARANSINARIQAWVARTMVHAHRKDFEAVHVLWRSLVDTLPDLGPSPTIVGRVIGALAGDMSVPRPTPGEVQRLPHDGQWLGAMCWLALGAAELDDAELARPLYDDLLDHESLVAVQGIGAGCHGSIAHWLGRLAWTLGRTEASARHLQVAADVHRRNGMPLHLAHSLAALGRIEGHEDRLVEATQLYRGMGLEHLAAPAPSPSAFVGIDRAGVFHRDGELWTVSFAGRTVQLLDSKGTRDISWLLGQPNTEVHVTELVAATEGTAPLHPARPPRPAATREPVIDERAKAAYRARVTELQDDIDDAEAAHDIERAARTKEELDYLLAELAASTGLGGRTRHMTDDVERARKAVTWRIRDALRRIAAVHPELARHLEGSISTGTFCSYRPPGEQHWQR